MVVWPGKILQTNQETRNTGTWQSALAIFCSCELIKNSEIAELSTSALSGIYTLFIYCFDIDSTDLCIDNDA